MRPYKSSFGHKASIFFFTSGSIVISSGQGRLKPSAGNLRVASTPVLGPKLGRRETTIGGSQPLINIAPVPDLNDQDPLAIRFHGVDDAAISAPHPEESAPSLKHFGAGRSRVFCEAVNPLADAFLIRLGKRRQVAQCSGKDCYAVNHPPP